MSYRQGQMDALYRLGFLKEGIYLPMAVGAATGAALGGAAGYQYAPHQIKGTGATVGALTGGALGAVGGGLLGSNAAEHRIKQLAHELKDYHARNPVETLEEIQAKAQKMIDEARGPEAFKPPKTLTREELEARIEKNMRERAKKKPN